MRNVIVFCVVTVMAATASADMSLEIVSVDNSAYLIGWVTHDLVLTTETDWLSSQMLVTLLDGSIYQDNLGGHTSPNPVWFQLVPTLEFDTYVSNGVVGDPVSAIGGAVDLGGDPTLRFSDASLNVNWFTNDCSDIGALALARVTLSDDAQGEWQVWMSAKNEHGEHFTMIVGAGIVNGQMVPEPATLSILALGALTLLRRRSR